MPLFHVHGLIAALLTSLVAGASVVCTPGFNPVKYFEWLDAMRPTWYTAVPTMHQAILALSERNHEIIVRRLLKFIRSATSPLPPQVMQELEATFRAPVIESYGMTEAAAQIASNPLPPGVRKTGSVGPAAGPEIAVTNERGEWLAAGETGEIVIRGANVMSGYEADPETNQAAFSGGWFRTGDRGYLDTDEYLFITGRLVETIKRGGEKISPREIDEAFLDHPSITQAVCFPIPDPQLGEDIAVAVVLREDHDLSAQELRKFATSRLAVHKIPTKFLIVDDIPKGPSGKPQRIGLGEAFLAARESARPSPQASIEQTLSEVLADLLQVDKIGIHDNFIALGVGSLQLIQLASRIESIFGQRPQLRTLFNYPTIAAIAAEIAQHYEE
jgi:acyl-CoA synthetase (AMP-forming)/AMP-acid ligase II/acyl carrier protein